jgi:hypothetical protein
MEGDLSTNLMSEGPQKRYHGTGPTGRWLCPPTRGGYHRTGIFGLQATVMIYPAVIVLFPLHEDGGSSLQTEKMLKGSLNRRQSSCQERNRRKIACGR